MNLTSLFLGVLLTTQPAATLQVELSFSKAVTSEAFSGACS